MDTHVVKYIVDSINAETFPTDMSSEFYQAALTMITETINVEACSPAEFNAMCILHSTIEVIEGLEA